MKEIKERLAKLISVKTIVTIALTIVFSILSMTGRIPSESVERIFMIVVAFYFGTQIEKKTNGGGDNNG